MSTLMSIASTGMEFGGAITAASTPNPGDVNTTQFATQLRNFAMPIVLLILGGMALLMLIKRQMGAMAGFLAAGVLVLALFINPNIIQGIANTVGSWFGG